MKVEVTIPAEKARFKQEMEKMDKFDTIWLYGSCVLHIIMTLILLTLSLYYSEPNTYNDRPSGYTYSTVFCLVMLACTLLICFGIYELSSCISYLYGLVKFLFQMVGMLFIIKSMATLEVISHIPKNGIPFRQLNIDIAIIFIAMFVGHMHEKFFEKVVLAKEKASRPKLIISWDKNDKKDKKQDELLKYEVKNEKDDNKDPLVINIDNNGIKTNNQIQPIIYVP